MIIFYRTADRWKWGVGDLRKLWDNGLGNDWLNEYRFGFWRAEEERLKD
jgi:hypothetical protein